MRNIFFKVLKKLLKKHYFKIYYIRRFFKFKTKSYEEILNLNRNDCYIYFLDYFYFKSKKSIFYHRKYFKNNNRGFGEDAFHSMWSFIFYKFKPITVLEIGVYRGQTLSQFEILSKELKLKSQVFGISPLTSDSDKVSKYAVLDYQSDIQKTLMSLIFLNQIYLKIFQQKRKQLNSLRLGNGI